jgi:pyruvate dehydrogenase E1 component alpha subunit
MTVQSSLGPPVAPSGTPGAQPRVVQDLLPSAEPIAFLDDAGLRLAGPSDYPEPDADVLLAAHRWMVIGRRLDAEAIALARQGRLAVYPSSRGQEACQVGGALSLAADDWMFPTYRECVALFARGIDPVEVLLMMRGDRHCGYHPVVHRTAPQATPLATQCLHAAGLAHGLHRSGSRAAVLAFVGDGATSEGDFHEALNFAAVFRSPMVFLVQNNRYAISVPLSRQSAAPALAYKGIGHGMRSEQVDGNDVVAVLAVLAEALRRARAGQGPTLVEAHTYRLEAHTTADDATRYRDPAEARAWLARDPVARLARYLIDRGLLDRSIIAEIETEAGRAAERLRAGLAVDLDLDPLEVFSHVFATPTPQLLRQRGQLAAELRAAALGPEPDLGAAVGDRS